MGMGDVFTSTVYPGSAHYSSDRSVADSNGRYREGDGHGLDGRFSPDLLHSSNPRLHKPSVPAGGGNKNDLLVRNGRRVLGARDGRNSADEGTNDDVNALRGNGGGSRPDSTSSFTGDTVYYVDLKEFGL